MKYSEFYNSYIKHLLTIVSLVIGVTISGINLFLAETIKDCIVTLMIFIVACSIIIINEIKVYIHNIKYNITGYIDKEYIYSCDINVISKLINNISKLCNDTDKCIESFIDCEYLATENYICFGDDDIHNFINNILRGISARYSYKVQESGYNRIIALNLWDINKKVCIYLTNLEDKQLISFRPIRKAQMMGLKVLSSEKSGSYKVEFYNPAIKLEIFNIFWVTGLIGMVTALLLNPNLMNMSNILVVLLAAWVFIWYLNKRRISNLTVLPKQFLIGMTIESELKYDIKNKMFDNIIKAYSLGKHRNYLQSVFNEQGIIYNDGFIFSKTEEEFDNLVKLSMDGIDKDYSIHKVFCQDGSRQAGIKFDTNSIIVLTLSRLDNGQIIRIT